MCLLVDILFTQQKILSITCQLKYYLDLVCTESTLRCIEESKRKPLIDQAVLLHKPHDRLVAVKRVIATLQVLLARAVVIKALALLSVRYGYLVFW